MVIRSPRWTQEIATSTDLLLEMGSGFPGVKVPETSELSSVRCGFWSPKNLFFPATKWSTPVIVTRPGIRFSPVARTAGP